MFLEKTNISLPFKNGFLKLNELLEKLPKINRCISKLKLLFTTPNFLSKSMFSL